MRCRRSWFLLSLMVTWVGCQGTPDTAEAGAPDAGGPDAGAGGLEAGEYRLATEDRVVEIRVFLPEGARAGAPFFVDDARASSRGRALVRMEGRFDGSGSSGNLCALTGCVLTLRASDPCASLETDPDGWGWYNPSGGDVSTPLPRSARLCSIPFVAGSSLFVSTPVGGGWDADSASLAPLAALGYRSSAPLDLATLASSTITVDGAPVPFTLDGASSPWEGALVLPAPIAVGSDVVFDPSVVRDVLGRPLDFFDGVLTTSSVATDLSFETPLPEGALAYAGHELVVEDGALVMRDEGRFPRAPFGAVLALGDPGTATVVRIDAVQAVRYGGRVVARVQRGSAPPEAAFALPYERGELAIPIPAGDGAIWLVLHSPQDLPQPQDIYPPEVFRIYGITLE